MKQFGIQLEDLHLLTNVILLFECNFDEMSCLRCNVNYDMSWLTVPKSDPLFTLQFSVASDPLCVSTIV